MLVLGDSLERLQMAREDAPLLDPLGLEALPGQRQRPLDDHVVDGDEVDLGLDARGVVQQRTVGVHEVAVEQRDVVVVQVLTCPFQAVLERAVVPEYLLVEAIEVLGVTGLIDLLGEQESLLVLVRGRHHQSAELAGHALLADEEGG